MTTHVVQQLVVAVTAALTGLATTGPRVYAQRPEEHALQPAELPALLVYDDGEEAEVADIAGATYRRTVALRVEIAAKAVAGLAAQVRQIRLEVETALAAGVTAGGGLRRIVYTGCDAMDTSGLTDRPVATQALRFTVDVYTPAAAPNTFG